MTTAFEDRRFVDVSLRRDGTSARPRPRKAGEAQRWASGLIAPCLLLAVWYLAAHFALLPPQILPAPEKVLDSLGDLIASGDLFRAAQISFVRVALGFLLGAGAGLFLGSMMGLFRSVDACLQPTFLAMNQIPVLAWLPLFMMLFGLGETLKLVVIARAVLLPVTINTLRGFRDAPANLIDVGRVYAFSPWQKLSKIVLPAALPQIFTGIRFGLTNAWLTLVVVELLASSEGLGYLMVWGRQLFQLDLVIGMMIVIGAVGYAMDAALQIAEHRILRRYGGRA